MRVHPSTLASCFARLVLVSHHLHLPSLSAALMYYATMTNIENQVYGLQQHHGSKAAEACLRAGREALP